MEIFGNNTNNNLSLFGNFFTDKNKNAQSQESFLTSKNNNNFSFNVKNYNNKYYLIQKIIMIKINSIYIPKQIMTIKHY